LKCGSDVATWSNGVGCWWNGRSSMSCSLM
jgi:hypothetical protein